jgi:mevalonate kinase
MLQKWHSNGKLILAGEYMVLFGARALALPLKLGQWLEVLSEAGEEVLEFTTFVIKEIWFKARFRTNSLEIIDTNHQSVAEYVQMVLMAARKLNHSFLRSPGKISAIATLDFNIEWGLGSSSTFTSNIAWWADIDPFELNRTISQGSGYDIACARYHTPLFYTFHRLAPVIEPVIFRPNCSEHIWFVYLGNKQSTEESLRTEIPRLHPTASEIKEISDITTAFANAATVEKLSYLIHRHENMIAGLLGREPVQSRQFSDFKGAVKSLGAWGGDFCMAVSEESISYVKNYFEQKGLTSVLTFNELVV